MHTFKPQSIGGQRAGFIHTEHIDIAERLYRIGLLHQRALAGDAHRPQRVGHADRQKQAVGHQPDDDDSHLERFYSRKLPGQCTKQQQQLEKEREQQQHANHQVDLALQGSVDTTKRARTCRQPVGDALRTYLLGPVERTAVHAKAARVQLIPLLLEHEIGLSCKQRLVNVDTLRLKDWPIHHNLIPWTHLQHIAHHYLLRNNRALLPVTNDYRRGSIEQSNPIEYALGPYLLDHTDHHVEQYHRHGHYGIADLAQQHQGQAQHKQDSIDRCKDVLANNLHIGSAGLHRQRIGEAL